MRSILCVAIGSFVPKFLKMYFFSGNIGNFSNFLITFVNRLISSQNTLPVQNLFNNIRFWGSYPIFRFYPFTRSLTRINENLSRYLSMCKTEYAESGGSLHHHPPPSRGRVALVLLFVCVDLFKLKSNFDTTLNQLSTL